MKRQSLVVIDSPLLAVIRQAPILSLNGQDIYLMTDDLITDIRQQIESSMNVSSSYQVVGYINGGRVIVNDGQSLNLDIYDFKQFMYGN